jgi:hypothetical protein
MAVCTWEMSETRFCDHIHQDVALETQLVFPADFLPDQNPRILSHRCSQGGHCTLFSQPTCVWVDILPALKPIQS